MIGQKYFRSIYPVLKVSWFRNVFLVSPNQPKNQQRISALAYKKGSNQKSRARVKIKFSNSWYKVPLFFLFHLFLEIWAEIQKYFHLFFGSNENFRVCFRDLLNFRVTFKMCTFQMHCKFKQGDSWCNMMMKKCFWVTEVTTLSKT